MISYVMIDAGFAYKLLVPNPQRDSLQKLIRQWAGTALVVCAPVLWLYELTSILTKTVHFGEIDDRSAQECLALAIGMGVQLISPDEEQTRMAYTWTRRLRRAAAYDSFYLAAAEVLGCEFWTVDRRLVNAANQPWVKLAEV